MITFTVLLALAAAESPAPRARPAQAVLADYARAIGGSKAWRRHKSIYLKRTISAKGMEIHGTEERYGTASGQSLSVSDIPGMGRFRQGSDGKVAWSEDPINGLRILSGVEDEEARIDAAWDGEVDLARSYQKVRSVAPPEPPPAGKRYECVELQPRSAPPAVTCFDAKTHLRVLHKGTRSSPQGAVPYIARFSDWRDVQGIKLPFSEETTAGPLTMEAQVQEVKLDPVIDATLFRVPRPDAGAGTPSAR
jgi:hypothetical protein